MKNIGIIGFGFVGKAIAHGFGYTHALYIYDKYGDSPNTIKEVVDNSDVIFVCVPTPMDEDGSQDLCHMDDVIKNIVDVDVYKRNIIVIKSTVIPGTTRKYSENYPTNTFIFNPEFLSEKTAKIDFLNQSRVILGGEDNDSINMLVKLYTERFPYVPIYITTWEGAEVSKYMANCFYSVKIAFMNEMYDIAEHIGVDYNDLRDMLLASGWVANMHMQVPGPDGKRGYGGKCLPKDVKAFYKWAESEGLTADMCKIADVINERIREGKDWLNIVGATTMNNYGERDEYK